MSAEKLPLGFRVRFGIAPWANSSTRASVGNLLLEFADPLVD